MLTLFRCARWVWGESWSWGEQHPEPVCSGTILPDHPPHHHRMIELRSGTILLDGLDISRVGVDVLRRQLAIIPQDPVLFSGTIRCGSVECRGGR